MSKYPRTDWTYGAEHEWGDWDAGTPLPESLALRCNDDWTMVNSSGVANDPKLKSFGLGGELNTTPTDTVDGQCDILVALDRLVAPTVNHRSNLHLHIRVPGLKDDVASLVRVQRFIHDWLPSLLEQTWPRTDSLGLRERHRKFPGWTPEVSREMLQVRRRRRNVSHATFLTETRLSRQLAATTVKEFFDWEVPVAKATQLPMFHAQPRVAMNLRQFLQTDTIEFRHFPGTLSSDSLRAAFAWCVDFLSAALEGDVAMLSEDVYHNPLLPKFTPFDPFLEWGYLRTCHDGSLKRPEIEANIQEILALPVEWVTP